MSSQYSGQAGALIGALPPAAVNIVSSTNASPIAVTATGHGLREGEYAVVVGHLVNTAANGIWKVHVVDANTITLVGSTGNGVGAATGTVRDAGIPAVPVVTDGDPFNAASVAVTLKSILDLAALSWLKASWISNLLPGGFFTASPGSSSTWLSGSSMLLLGTVEVDTDITVDATRKVIMLGTAETNYHAGAFISGQPTLKNAAVLKVESGATIDFNTGLLFMRSGSTATMGGTSTFGGSATFNNTTILNGPTTVSGDLSISGPTLLVGANATVGKRRSVLSATTGTVSLNVTDADIWQVKQTLTGNVTVNPAVGGSIPDGFEATFSRQVNAGSSLSSFNFTLNDGLGNGITSFGVGSAGTIRIFYNATRGAWDT